MEARLREVYAGFDAEVGYMVDRVALTVPRERIADACRVARTTPGSRSTTSAASPSPNTKNPSRPSTSSGPPPSVTASS